VRAQHCAGWKKKKGEKLHTKTLRKTHSRNSWGAKGTWEEFGYTAGDQRGVGVPLGDSGESFVRRVSREGVENLNGRIRRVLADFPATAGDYFKPRKREITVGGKDIEW